MNINEENIYSLLLDYNEGNLNKDEKKELEDFLDKNQKYKVLQEKYSKIEYLNENIKFENKNSILSYNQQQKVINQTLQRQRNILRYVSIVSSAAAVVFLCLFILKPQQKIFSTKTIVKNSPITEKIVYKTDTIFKESIRKDTVFVSKQKIEDETQEFYKSVLSLFDFGMNKTIEGVRLSQYNKTDTCARIEFCDEGCKNNGNMVFEVENNTVKGILSYSIN